MKKSNIVYIILFSLIFSSCSKDEAVPMPVLDENINLLNDFKIEIGEKLLLQPKINLDNLDFSWKVNGLEVSQQAIYEFPADKLGDFEINFLAKNATGKVNKDYTVQVYQIRKSDDSSSPYLTQMLDYKPAPGQFVNEEMLGTPEAAESILGKPKYGMVSLGGFGGYISVGFDHTIMNIEGTDFIVYGNAFDGSSEPGIVMVSFDYNGNQEADDPWFELASSEYNAEKTIHNYTITYTNPKGYLDIPWTDNQGGSGVLKINEYHEQEYYPAFRPEQESISFTGTLLEDKTNMDYKHPVYGSIVYNPAREWGYVDNYSAEYDDRKANNFDLDWAVNNKGEKVVLPGVDFIKIYTATNVDGGWLGENSTEIMGAADLSLLK